MQYNVGQVVYLLDPSRNAVLPARVFEQVTKKTIDGEEEYFYVEVPGAKSLLNLSDFEGMVFDTPESVKDHLFNTLKNNILNLVEKATTEALELWGETAKPITKTKKSGRGRGRPKKKPEQVEEIKLDSPETLVDLGDGRVARFKED